MYEIILNALIGDMHSFGLVSTIVISQDYYCSMSKKEINHLNSFLTGNIKWTIVSDKKQYWFFLYSSKPVGFENE